MKNNGERASLLEIPQQMQRYRSLSFDASASSTRRQQPTLSDRAAVWARGARETLQYSRDNVFLVMAILLLVICTATDRVTYKMTVDRMLPYSPCTATATSRIMYVLQSNIIRNSYLVEEYAGADEV
jgi:hypothetical protein